MQELYARGRQDAKQGSGDCPHPEFKDIGDRFNSALQELRAGHSVQGRATEEPELNLASHLSKVEVVHRVSTRCIFQASRLIDQSL